MRTFFQNSVSQTVVGVPLGVREKCLGGIRAHSAKRVNFLTFN
jgi:hypothetical protein